MKTEFRIGLALAILACLLICPCLKSQDITIDNAAVKFWLEKNPQKIRGQNFQFDRISRQGEATIYEKFNPASFIILVKTSEGFIPAGYSFQNLFFGNADGPTAQSELVEALEAAGRADPGKLKGGRSMTGSVGPIFLTKWGQGDYFNFYCPRDPNGPNGRVYVGCVAVAMGQILKYFEGFNSFNIQHSYQSGFYGNLSANLGSYDWQSMENSPVTVDMETSKFLADVGILINTSFGASGSTAISHRTLEAFHELGYINGILLRKSKFSAESWSEIFYQNLTDYKPVLVTGGGHAFVCDGYTKDGFFHFNLGWDGYADGYYPLAGVLTMPVNEAFTELEPITWPKPPKNIDVKISLQKEIVTWNYEQGQKPSFSRVYADGRLILETADTLINTSILGSGIHEVHVSAVYPEGESRWIGPVESMVRGNPLIFSDPILYEVIKNGLRKVLSDTEISTVYEGDLSRIVSLEIDQPVKSMEGLGLCNHLKRLVIDGSSGLALDAGPLKDLSQLRILEWNDREILHPEILGDLSKLAELRFRKTALESFDFLKEYKNLLKFGYSGAPIGAGEGISRMRLLEELELSGASLADASFVAGMDQLIRLDLSGNNLEESSFLLSLPNLKSADLSGNHLASLLLSEQLKSLSVLDVSDNSINTINVLSDLKSLTILNLSDNKLKTPGRLFIYTPALQELDLSRNNIRTLGNLRCQNLAALDVSGNELISTDWISNQPSLKRINLEHNRISDLSGLMKNHLYKQVDFLGLANNPLSKQSFNDWLPLLTEAVDSVTKPNEFQPLSPCYAIPANGGRLVGSGAEFQWSADTSGQACVYDLFIVSGDSLVPVLTGLGAMKAVLEQRPSAAFSWVVGARTSDSVFYSGIYYVVSTSDWKLPFRDGFENYEEGSILSQQSDSWFSRENETEAGKNSLIVTENSADGGNCLEINGKATAILSAEHLEVPYISIQFSAFVPPGQHAKFRINNMNGINLALEWDSSNVGKFYYNDKLFSTFDVDHQAWINYEILGHARNNCLYAKAGSRVLINEPWMLPEGIIRTESLEFTGQSENLNDATSSNVFYIDEVKIISIATTSVSQVGFSNESLILAYPNPFKDFINISIAEPGTYNLSILDVSGREVDRQVIEANGNTANTIPLTGLSPGVYFICPAGYEFKPIKIMRGE
jgi:Leucine-rich repeat (LRR) protein